jgi:hypothetical protein
MTSVAQPVAATTRRGDGIRGRLRDWARRSCS